MTPALSTCKVIYWVCFELLQISVRNLGVSWVLISKIEPHYPPQTRILTRYLVEGFRLLIIPIPLLFSIFLKISCPFILSPTPYSISYWSFLWGRCKNSKSIWLWDDFNESGRLFNGFWTHSKNNSEVIEACWILCSPFFSFSPFYLSSIWSKLRAKASGWFKSQALAVEPKLRAASCRSSSPCSLKLK